MTKLQDIIKTFDNNDKFVVCPKCGMQLDLDEFLDSHGNMMGICRDCIEHSKESKRMKSSRLKLLSKKMEQ